jgi:hypothetical protein
MEDNYAEPAHSLFDIEITESVMYSLEQSAKWARFLAFFISGCFVILVLAFLVSGSAYFRMLGDRFEGHMQIYLLIFFGLMIGIGGVFAGLLFNFSYKIKQGVAARDIEKLQQGISSLKAYFIYIGLLMLLWVVVISLSVLAIIIR